MARPASQAPVPALPILGWFETGRTTPLRLGLWIFLAVIALRAVVILAFVHLGPLLRAETPPVELRDVRIGLVFALVLGYGPASYGWAVRGLRTQLDALRPLLAGSGRTLDDSIAQAGHLAASTRRRCVAWGAFGALLVPLLVDRDPTLFLDPGYWNAQNVLNWIQLPFAGALVTCVVRSAWEDARRLTRLADRTESLDLLDPRALAPFGRQALRIALLTAAFPSVGAVLVSDRGFAALIALIAVATAAIATTAFLLPVQGIHRRLVREKVAELARVRAALRGDVGALEKSGLRAWRGRASPADLLAYEARIEAVREWPFDVPMLARFAALFLLPVGSWLGGALVERVVSQLLR